MDRRQTTYTVLAVAFLASWPLAMPAADVPFAIGAALWLAVLLVALWFLVRPMLFGRPGHL